jgi:hypothetical protein
VADGNSAAVQTPTLSRRSTKNAKESRRVVMEPRRRRRRVTTTIFDARNIGQERSCCV